MLWFLPIVRRLEISKPNKPSWVWIIDVIGDSQFRNSVVLGKERFHLAREDFN
jgi:hypothetical protein